MRVLFMGTPDFAAASLRELLKRGFEVVGVFTQPDKPVGRKRVLEKPPVKLLAEEAGVPVYQPVKLRDGTALEVVKSLAPEVIAVVAYGRILPNDILEYPKYGCVNIHGSILPKYRGAAPIQWAVINGETETGVTAMYMAEALDAGDILEIRKTPVLAGETSGELFERLAPMGAELLCDTLVSIENGTAVRTPQNDDEATFAPPLRKEDAPLDWTKPGRAIVSAIHGLDPWPVALTDVITGSPMKVYNGRFIEKSHEKPCGTVLSAGKEGIEVACPDGSVLITEVQAQGGKRMSAGEYLRGHPLRL